MHNISWGLNLRGRKRRALVKEVGSQTHPTHERTTSTIKYCYTRRLREGVVSCKLAAYHPQHNGLWQSAIKEWLASASDAKLGTLFSCDLGTG